MCGICWLIFKQIDCVHHNEACEFWKTSRIQQRGPDSFYNCSTCDGQTISQFCGFTLHFQGELTPQPLINEAGNIFLWNGEVFGGIETNGRNDGMVILDQLNKCSTDVDVLSVFAKIYGPWSFIYWQKKQKRIWFGRDVFGRRSLLFHSPPEACCFALSSVAAKSMDPWKEVPATGIYSMDVKADTLPRNNSITHYPYILNTDLSDCCKIEKMNANSTIFNNTVDKDSNIWEGFNIVESNLGIKIPISTFNSTFPSIDSKCEDSCMDASKITTDTIEKLASPEQLLLRDELINILGEAVKVRVERQSHLCHDCITNNLRSREFEVKCKVKTLLVNNDQDEEYSASSMTANKEVDNLTGEQKSTIHLSSQTSDKPDQSSCDKNTIKETSESDSSICSIDREQKEDCQLSVKDVRSCRGDDACKLLSVQKSCGHSRVAILFSGGIDSLVIAALADRYVPEGEPIDLLNVAFEQREKPHTDKKKTQDTSHVKQRGHFNVPDRITGIDGLKQLNSARQWNFVEINVTVDELQDARTRHVKGLVYPLNTVLDDSIGCAIWFAARGQGVIRKGDNISPYTTTTRVVLVGMGADEQLVGYSRHRVKYKNEGLTGLVAEIKMEIERISARNLGRDDRIISDHSKEARFPFLDEHVVSFLNDLPILQKANLDLPRGVGEKFLLRLAAVKLGLGDSSLLPKRAIQFGSRIAKIENKKEKASDVCDRL